MDMPLKPNILDDLTKEVKSKLSGCFDLHSLVFGLTVERIVAFYCRAAATFHLS